MTTPPEIARKVRQLDNDVQGIYEMLAGISATQQRQGNRLEEIAIGQADLAAGQAEHGTKLDAILELLRGGPPPTVDSFSRARWAGLREPRCPRRC